MHHLQRLDEHVEFLVLAEIFAHGGVPLNEIVGRHFLHPVKIALAPGIVPHLDSLDRVAAIVRFRHVTAPHRSEEHTSELQSLMRISYAVFCLKKKKKSTRS